MARTAALDEVRDRFKRSGTNITAWAIDHDFAPERVFSVLAGRSKGVRGQARRIAVALGLEEACTFEIAKRKRQ